MMDKETYANYFSDPRWRDKRNEVIKSHNFKCDNCGSLQNLNVHHKRYFPDVMPWEYLLDYYKVLCEKCHTEEHGINYVGKKCKKCGVIISISFEYCYVCYKKLKNNIEIETEQLEANKRKLEAEKSDLKKQTDNLQLYEEVKLQLESNKIRIDEIEKSALKNKTDKPQSSNDIINHIEASSISHESRKQIHGQKLNLIKILFAFIGIIFVGFVITYFNIIPNVKKNIYAKSIIISPEKNTDNFHTPSTIESSKKSIITLEKQVDKEIETNSNKNFKPLNKEYKKNSNAFTNQPFIKAQKTEVLKNHHPQLDNLKTFIGKEVSLNVKVDQVSLLENGNLYLNIGGKFPKQKLTLVIFKKDIRHLSNISEFQNKYVKVNGVISIYNDVPQIIINKPSQIELPIPVTTQDNSISKLNNIKQYIGKNISLTIKVDQVSLLKNDNICLNIGGIFPNNKLTLVIFKDVASQFGNIAELENKLIQVSGVVTQHNSKPQIIIKDSKQIVKIAY